MDKIKEFFHTKTPKEIMQENKRAIRRARRELEREKNRLNNEKTRNENEIRKLAAKGEQVRMKNSSFFRSMFFHSFSFIESIKNLCKKYRQSAKSNQ